MNQLKIENEFLIGFYSAADGSKTNKQNKYFILLKRHKITITGLNYLCQSLGLKTYIGMRNDKFNIFHLNTVNNVSDEKVHKIVILGKKNDYVYDIETETHDFNCGFPLIVHNTNSFVLSVNTKNIIQDLHNLKEYYSISVI